MWAVYKKELKTYFYSPLAYVLSGYLYWFRNILFNSDNVQSGTGYCPVCVWWTALFCKFWLVMLIPILTMRVFAEERRNGTEVLLMTSPVSVPQIVIGKFLAAFTVF